MTATTTITATTLQVPQGQFVLQRRPRRRRETLRAWDAADEYLLHEVTLLNSLEQPTGPVDLVLIKVPR